MDHGESTHLEIQNRTNILDTSILKFKAIEVTNDNQGMKQTIENLGILKQI